MPRTLLYVAYPMRLDLGAANAIQTHSTVRELQRILPGMRLVVPRWLHEPSAFSDLGALHLPRPAVNKISKFVPWAGWSYIERTLYAFMLVTLLVAWRLAGRGYRVLYVRDAVCAAWLALLKPLHGSRVIYEVHDLEASHPSKASKWPPRLWRHFLPWLDRAALTRSHKLVSLTQSFRQWVVSSGTRTGTDIAVIPDAYDPHVYFPAGQEQARTALGLPTDVPIIGYTGLTFAYRRLDLLVKAFASVLARHPYARLVLVGGRPGEIEELRRLAKELGIKGGLGARGQGLDGTRGDADEGGKFTSPRPPAPSPRVIFPGQVSQRKAALYLNASDLLIIPDTVTGMTASPLKLFEYMAVGKPIVCKEMPALREILDDSSAVFFEGGSEESLAAAIDGLLDEPERGMRLGAAALDRAQGYTYRARAEMIAEVVRS